LQNVYQATKLENQNPNLCLQFLDAQEDEKHDEDLKNLLLVLHMDNSSENQFEFLKLLPNIDLILQIVHNATEKEDYFLNGPYHQKFVFHLHF